MRHGKKNNHLSRTDSHRRSMLSNMASSLILHKRITTTLAKAKALRMYVEPLITKSKTDSTHSRRTAFSYLKDKEVVAMLFREIAEKVATRPGGYTRILKLGNRMGDNASMALIELVDFNELYISGDVAIEKKTTRRRGAKAKKTTDAPVTEAKVAPKVEDEEVKAAEVEEEKVKAAEVEEEKPEEESKETPESEGKEPKGE